MTLALHRRAALLAISASLVPLRRARAETGGVPLELSCAPLLAKLGPELDEAAELWAFNGAAAPPVLRVRHGDPLAVRFRNATPKPLSLHWHGVRGPATLDGVGGVSGPAVAPGAMAEIRFVPPDPGTFLIRPLAVGSAGEAGGRGVAGLLIVEEREPPAVDADFAFLVRDWRLEPSGALSPFGRVEDASLAGRLGNRLAVEGEFAPRRITLRSGSRVRLRIANGCNARNTRIRFDGIKAYVAAVDGQPTDTFEPLRSNLPFAPGTRYDLFFDLPREPGATGTVTALVGPGLPLVELATVGEPVPQRSGEVVALPANPALPPEIKLQNALRPEITIGGGAIRGPDGKPVFTGDPSRIWTVNGQAGNPSAPPLFIARRGQPVVIGFSNTTSFVQPIHLHGHVLRILHALDDGWEPYWLDTLQVPEGRTVRVAFMADNPGRWTISSTVLERFDTGLWTTFQVA